MNSLRNEKELEDIVKKKLEDTDVAHGWEHVKRVLYIATELAEKYETDIETLRLACIVHDVERSTDLKNHAQKAAEMIQEYMMSKGYTEQKIEKVKDAVLYHHANPDKIKSIEGKILFDADKLDAVGVVGLARCLQEAGYKGQSIEEAIAYLQRDAKEFIGAMHFKETKEMMKYRVKTCEDALKELRKELRGSK